jgi:hypothetical protein
VNKNKSSPRLAYWVYESGNIGRAFSPEYKECKNEAKHDGVHELILSYDELLKKYERCMSEKGDSGEVCGIIYTVAKTGQRIGSREDTATELYMYDKDIKGKPKRIVTGHIQTYGISTLRARHVHVDGERVYLNFIGKNGQQHSHVIESAIMAEFFRRMLDGKGTNDPVFTPHIYRTVYVKFKHDTGHTIKDLRTAMAHLLVPMAKKEWIEKYGEPANKTQEKKMLRYAVNKAAEILGNKPGTLKRSYANPDDIKPAYR